MNLKDQLPKIGKEQKDGSIIFLGIKISRPDYENINPDNYLGKFECLCLLLGVDMESFWKLTKHKDAGKFLKIINEMNKNISFAEQKDLTPLEQKPSFLVNNYSSLGRGAAYEMRTQPYFKLFEFIEWAKKLSYKIPQEIESKTFENQGQQQLPDIHEFVSFISKELETFWKFLLRRAKDNYEIKYGEHEVGLYNWNRVTGDKTNDKQRRLMSKLPQLESAKAAVEMAQANLEKAQLDLERTVIKSPFNAIILEENIEVGAQVQPSKQLARLAGTDEYWVEISLPLDRLRWIGAYPGKIKNVPALIQYPNGEAGTTVWHGTVLNIKGELEQKGRMVRLIVNVKNPLGKKTGNHSGPVLIAGSHVRVAIYGRNLKNVYVIPRSALHENDTVWVANVDDKLKLRKVEVKWKERDEVVISSGIKPGERLIISDLAAPVEGMLLTVEMVPENTLDKK